MHVLCYATPEDKNGVELRQTIQGCMPGAHTEYYTTIEGFKRRLLRNLDRKTVAVVSIVTEQDLIDIYFIQHLLNKVLLVLLLPDREYHTIAMGHRLHPCFMCCADPEMPDLAEVLKNITQHGSPLTCKTIFKNPFEALTPLCPPEFQKDPWIYAAA